MSKILITGTAGFIGFHLVKPLIGLGYTVVGIDNINNYYDTQIKYDRLKETGIDKAMIEWHKPVESSKYSNYSFIQMNLEDKDQLEEVFRSEKFDFVCHLAAQAGARDSLNNPKSYIDSNISGFLNILEGCKKFNVKNLIYASSSSVYGMNSEMPLKTDSNNNQPVSFYAVSKMCNELMAFTYGNLYGIKTTGLRLFTVYGPWGRPDMALFIFTRNIIAGKPIKVFNHGELYRDFTYIDDIISGIVLAIKKQENSISQNREVDREGKCSEIYNIGNSSPVKLLDFIAIIEQKLNKKAVVEMLPMQPGDVEKTYADISKSVADLGYNPTFSIEAGVDRFIDWYKNYFKIK